MTPINQPLLLSPGRGGHSCELVMFALIMSLAIPYVALASQVARAMDEHAAHGAPLVHLNESDILLSHGPDPLSYASHDFWPSPDFQPWPSLMIIHVIATSVAFLAILPVAIALRSVAHPWHGVVQTAFHIFLNLGIISATLYTHVTPDLYAGSTHARSGYVLLAAVLVISLCDLSRVFRRIVEFFRKPSARLTVSAVWRLITAPHVPIADADECLHLTSDVDGGTARDQHGIDSPADEEWAHSRPPSPTSSSHSESTLHDPHTSPHKQMSFAFPLIPQRGLRAYLAPAGNAAFHFLEHALVLLAFAQALSGLTVYSGTCRGNYANGCLAHLVKGGIFIFYGVLSFARYLGAFAGFGWAWNRRPATAPKWVPSAEMVESAVIFVYGATNTWMERFGAAKGSAYTTKQIQHISIAVMFCFAGLGGMAIESRRVRRWLAGPALLASVTENAHNSDAHVDELADSHETWDAPSLNPFPALVVGVTGLAMSAHHQTYLFQVQIHALWGWLLAAFGAMRWLTYFLTWSKWRAGRPNTSWSVEPSRPPTELLASFCLACGGLVFVLSMEQVSFYAMRSGYDDVMMFMNLSVAVTCLAFTWILAILAIDGYLKRQLVKRTRRWRRNPLHADTH